MRPSLVVGLAISLGAVAGVLSRASAQSLAGETKDLTFVGFQQFEEGSRVFVRTSDKVSYRVDTSREGMVVLVLENTRVPVFNNTRLLDTSRFDSPIRSVQAKVIEEPSQSVQVEIRLRRRVPFKESQNDTVVALDFARQ